MELGGAIGNMGRQTTCQGMESSGSGRGCGAVTMTVLAGLGGREMGKIVFRGVLGIYAPKIHCRLDDDALFAYILHLKG